jgi:sulfonate transport system substrate-binding protein
VKLKLAGAVAAMVIAAGIVTTGCGSSSSAADLGKKGQPVHLVIGYQPYYTEAWSAVVMKEKEFWKGHLPKGSTVEFQVGLQGSIIIGQMLAGKQQIGYVGDMPSIVGVSKQSVKPLSIVATAGESEDSCGVFLVSKDAPEFKSQSEAIRWMNGKSVADPQGSCADRIAQAAFEQEGVKPSEYLNQSLDLVTSDFEKESIDAASVWEPVGAKLVDEGLAKRVASGAAFHQTTAAFIVMSQQLLEERPEIAEGWLEAELEAEEYMSDPANQAEVAKMAVNQTTGYTEAQMHDALFKSWPAAVGGAADGTKLEFPFAVTPEVGSLIKSASAFLYKIKSIDQAQLPPSAVDGKLAEAVLKKAGSAPQPIKGSPSGAE